MPIPWATALYLFRKVLPVVIPVVMEKAPELLKTLERRRTTESTDSAPADDPLVLLQQRIDALEHVASAQTELLTALQAQIRATRRSLTLVWASLLAAILIAAAIGGTLLLRS
ncbi:MAG TPA: hypothetical protein VHF07_03455 [Nitrospiraceae bacterium]|nr:hypothetical protein [Nitrospiraceae bacterium]